MPPLRVPIHVNDIRRGLAAATNRRRPAHEDFDATDGLFNHEILGSSAGPHGLGHVVNAGAAAFAPPDDPSDPRSVQHQLACASDTLAEGLGATVARRVRIAGEVSTAVRLAAAAAGATPAASAAPSGRPIGPGSSARPSRFRGVSWSRARNKWQAKFHSDGQRYDLGVFESEEDAAHAYDNKAVEIVGDRARTNFPHPSGKGRVVPKKKTSRFRGVSLAAKVVKSGATRWAVKVTYLGQQYRLGLFESEDDAGRAYDRKLVEVAGSAEEALKTANFPAELRRALDTGSLDTWMQGQPAGAAAAPEDEGQDDDDDEDDEDEEEEADGEAAAGATAAAED